MAQTQTYDERELKSLREAVEEAFGEKITGPKSINHLRLFLHRRTGVFLGVTTLKRIWLYIREESILRESTLSVLARAIGYEDFNDFHRRFESGSKTELSISSTPKFKKYINVSTDLSMGEELMIYWYPGRECQIRYLGGMQFEVMASKNTRLKPGDKFLCHLILPGHPLYLSSLTTSKDSKPMAYICGKLHGGIQYEFLTSAKRGTLPGDDASRDS